MKYSRLANRSFFFLNLFELLLAQLVLPFLGLQEAVELFLLLALDVLLELLLIIGKVLGLREGGKVL